MSDEQFAADLRPDSIFGSLGASDFDDDESEEYGDMVDGWGIGEDDLPPNAAPQPTQQEVPDYTETPTSNGASVVQANTSKPGRGGAAVTLFFLVGGAALGWHFGGKFKGAAGGALTAGAVRNLYRAQRGMRSPSANEKAGAIRPGLIGLVGLAGGGYLLYTAKGR